MTTKQGYAYHNPLGDPCGFINARGEVCGLAGVKHRVGHIPAGDPCRICGLHFSAHYRPKSDWSNHYYVGIDGEGQGRDPHRYMLLAWSSESGHRSQVIEAEPGAGLTTKQCLDFMLDLPHKARPFAFAFGYDLTMMLADLPTEMLYYLFRPELRKGHKGTVPIDLRILGPDWAGYQINLIASKFSVQRGKNRVHIWDVFKFFQSKFTKALIDWKVAPEAELERMERMKSQRGDFDKLDRDDIREYCLEECRHMATLARRLTEGHEEAGLKLKAYFGAGSTSSALLDSWNIRDEVRTSPHPEMTHPIACAFFGGRFEHSMIGPIARLIFGADISAAYPYEITFLPCLACGKWERTTNRRDLDNATTAVVRYKLHKGTSAEVSAWAPFPFRTDNGSIVFPDESGGGWVWLSEYLAGERLYSGVQFLEAWVYRTQCDHRPFARMPEVYRERCRIGKEGPGIVLKLGSNGTYGKLAQSLGEPKFQSWIWAGMITAGTRAQILDVIGLHKDRANLLIAATDGIYTLEDIDLPKPRDTGTDDVMSGGKRKPLGGWETSTVEGGLFLARPGIYFPLRMGEGKDAEKKMRARGLGRRTMIENRQVAMDAYAAGQSSVHIANVTRFNGAKSSIYRVGDQYVRRAVYGQWTTRPIEMTFDPLPKRDGITPEGRLLLRSFPNEESKPYSNAIGAINPDAVLMKLAALELSEQPDGFDFTEYDLTEYLE